MEDMVGEWGQWWSWVCKDWKRQMGLYVLTKIFSGVPYKFTCTVQMSVSLYGSEN